MEKRHLEIQVHKDVIKQRYASNGPLTTKESTNSISAKKPFNVNGEQVINNSSIISNRAQHKTRMQSIGGSMVEPTLHQRDSLQIVPCRWSSSGWKYLALDPQDQQFFGNPNRVNIHGCSPVKVNSQTAFSPRESQIKKQQNLMGDKVHYNGQVSQEQLDYNYFNNNRNIERKQDENRIIQQSAKGGVYNNNNHLSSGIQSLRSSFHHDDTLIKAETYKTSYTNQFNEKNASKNRQSANEWKVGTVSAKNGKLQTQLVDSSDDVMQWAGELHKRSDFNKKRDRLTNWTNVCFKV